MSGVLKGYGKFGKWGCAPVAAPSSAVSHLASQTSFPPKALLPLSIPRSQHAQEKLLYSHIKACSTHVSIPELGQRSMPGKGGLLFWLMHRDGSTFKSVICMVRSSHVLETRGRPQICLIQAAKTTRG